MRLLLDTHIFLWVMLGSARLSKAATQMISQAEEVYVSSASVWEAAIKSSTGKLDLDMSILSINISKFGYIELPVRISHSLVVSRLPKIHKDPFDRMLVAQAVSETLNLLSADKRLAGYSELVITV